MRRGPRAARRSQSSIEACRSWEGSVTQSLRCGCFLARWVSILSSASAGAFARSPSYERAERVVLANGLEVVLVAEPATPTLAVVSSAHAGTRHDPPGYAGLAHFVQHLRGVEVGAARRTVIDR